MPFFFSVILFVLLYCFVLLRSLHFSTLRLSISFLLFFIHRSLFLLSFSSRLFFRSIIFFPLSSLSLPSLFLFFCTLRSLALISLAFDSVSIPDNKVSMPTTHVTLQVTDNLLSFPLLPAQRRCINKSGFRANSEDLLFDILLP